jgi:hypothetical protein
MEEIWAVLQDVTYPTTKADLVVVAIAAGARPDLVERLESLPEDGYANADELGRDLSSSRASSNPALVAITLEPCPECGFPRVPGEAHSCIEEKARFAESANRVTDEFEALDDGRTA